MSKNNNNNMCFYSLFNWCIYLFLVYEYLNKKFPDEVDKFLITVNYNIVYYFSKLQIFLKKYYNNFNKNENKHIEEEEEDEEEDELFEFIKDNEVNFSMNKEELLDYLDKTVMDEIIDELCDFVLLSNNKNDFKILNKDCITLDKLKNIDLQLLKITPINYKPILCEINVDSLNIKINFQHKDGDYNYLILDNKFDAIFIRYFMKKHYRHDIEKESNFILKILDDKVMSINIDNNEVLKIEENGMIKI